jgi:hypothetical protein
MTEVIEQNNEPTLTIADKSYLISELSNQVKELVSLYEQASQLAINAKRQAAIHDIAVASIVSMIEKAVVETEE